MKIDLTKLDLTQFMAHDHFVAGEVVTLVQPQHIGTKWRQDNKHLRSSVWNYQGELISAGFPKFTNFGENPEHFPVPQSLKNCTVVEKLDGSLLIVSKYKGQLILRTRGTVDAFTMDNGHELEIFKEKFLNSINHATPDTWNVSILFEWVSPQNKIVINYGAEPDWYVVGIVRHDDYSLFEQSELDMWAKNKNFKRPATYTFSDVNDLLENVEQWKGKEGVVIYSQDGQMLHKVKGAWYLALHNMKSELSSTEKVMDVWLEQKMPDYNSFYNYISTTFDFELAEQIRGTISNLCDGRKEVDKIIDHMRGFINSKVRHLTSRKEQALTILNSYGETNRSGYLFKILDNKPLEKDDYKKLMFQILKRSQ
jgi:T4 RnlA family RNA ligase